MSDNPLIQSLKLPGRIFQLPSRGIFYHNGELADNIRDGEVHVQAMSALDEISMKNPDQLFSGEAVNTVFSTCIKGINKPSELLSKDVDAIMIFLRVVTYGSSYDFTAKHNCENGKDHNFSADIEKIITSMKVVDPTLIEKQYTINLPNGQVIKLKPNKYQQVLDLLKKNEARKELTAKDQQENMVMMLLGIIESVNGLTDQKLIAEWIKAIPSTIVNRITEKIENINDWGADLRWECQCPECGARYKVEIPVNPISFFNE